MTRRVRCVTSTRAREKDRRSAPIAETARLTLRQFDAGDAAFILELVNDPSWLRFIGNKNVGTLDDARRYILNGPVKMYARFGFGLWAVDLKERGMPVGMCGLIKRDALEDVDIGFAFLAAHRGRGYAFEAASATASYGWTTLGLARIVAITSPGNDASERLLGKLGFRFERMTRLVGDASDVELYAAQRGGDSLEHPVRADENCAKETR